MPWRPMSPLRITASPASISGGPDAEALVDQSDARRRHVESVALAALDDLGVAGDDRDPRGLRGRGSWTPPRS